MDAKRSHFISGESRQRAKYVRAQVTPGQKSRSREKMEKTPIFLLWLLLSTRSQVIHERISRKTAQRDRPRPLSGGCPRDPGRPGRVGAGLLSGPPPGSIFPAFGGHHPG